MYANNFQIKQCLHSICSKQKTNWCKIEIKVVGTEEGTIFFLNVINYLLRHLRCYNGHIIFS